MDITLRAQGSLGRRDLATWSVLLATGLGNLKDPLEEHRDRLGLGSAGGGGLLPLSSPRFVSQLLALMTDGAPTPTHPPPMNPRTKEAHLPGDIGLPAGLTH